MTTVYVIIMIANLLTLVANILTFISVNRTDRYAAEATRLAEPR